MLGLNPVDYFYIGIVLIGIVLIYFFRDHISDLAGIVAGHKKLFIICVVLIFVAYFALTYKLPPQPLPPPQYVPFTNNITQIGYKWPGSP